MLKLGEAEINLLDYWRVLVKRRWVFFTLVAGCFFLVALHTFMQRPLYTATSRLQIERRALNILPFQEISGGIDYLRDFYETQYELIGSRRVAREVIRSLRLDRNPEFGGAPPAGEAMDETAAALRDSRIVDLFLGRLQVLPVSNSTLVDVSYTLGDPETAARIANRVAEAYIGFNSEARYNTTERATTSLAHQIADLQEEIDGKEEELQGYAREQGIVHLGDEKDIEIKNLDDLQIAFTRAQAGRIEKEARYSAMRDLEPEALPETVGAPLVGDLAAKAAELERRYAQMSETYKPDWPEMVRLRTELEETRSRLAEERNTVYQQVLQNAESDFQAARNEEETLARTLEDQKRDILDLQAKEIHYKNLKSEIANRRSTLEALVKRQTETQSSIGVSDVASGNIRIVDPAEIPRAASHPNIPANLALGLMLGLFLGVGTVFVLEYVDRSIVEPEEMQAAAGIVCLGLVPQIRPSGGWRFAVVRAGRRSHDREIEQVTRLRPKAKASEAFREIRTSLLVSRPGGPPRTILVTSAQPGEGKTLTALNLSITLAQSGRRILIIDADLRKPRLHKILDAGDGPGVTHFLSGTGPQKIHPLPSGIAGLDFLASGPLPPGPADLLDSERFDQLCQEALAAGYDHLVIDAPPVLAVTDPVIIARRVEAVILVVRAGSTSREAMVRAVERLRQGRASIVGAILNQADIGLGGYGGYYGPEPVSAEGREAEETVPSSGG